MKSSPASSFDFNVVTETANRGLPHQPAVRFAGHPVLELIYPSKDSFGCVCSAWKSVRLAQAEEASIAGHFLMTEHTLYRALVKQTDTLNRTSKHKTRSLTKPACRGGTHSPARAFT
jgi:hypothetical protein